MHQLENRILNELSCLMQECNKTPIHLNRITDMFAEIDCLLKLKGDTLKKKSICYRILNKRYNNFFDIDIRERLLELQHGLKGKECIYENKGDLI